MSTRDIYYGQKYPDSDGVYEYRHVILPKEIAAKVPKRLMTEQEWRNLGVQMSQGWENYLRHGPEPHVLLFKRRIVQ